MRYPWEQVSVIWPTTKRDQNCILEIKIYICEERDMCHGILVMYDEAKTNLT